MVIGAEACTFDLLRVKCSATTRPMAAIAATIVTIRFSEAPDFRAVSSFTPGMQGISGLKGSGWGAPSCIRFSMRRYARASPPLFVAELSSIDCVSYYILEIDCCRIISFAFARHSNKSSSRARSSDVCVNPLLASICTAKSPCALSQAVV
jgi:hypothetical protein